jgi:hypothetical protein
MSPIDTSTLAGLQPEDIHAVTKELVTCAVAPFACRSCGRRNLDRILSLGRMPLANSYLHPEEVDEQTYPLDVVFCRDCSLVQITETVSPEVLFGDYLYFSSYSETVVNNAREISQRMIAGHHLDASSLVAEIASNDGYLLQFYRQAGIPVLGIEPAANVAEVAIREKGVPTLCEFFSSTLAQRLRREGRRVNVLHGNNVLAHVADLNGVAEGIRHLLKDTGVGVLEVPYVKDMIDRCEFDTIYHEHLCYFSLTALDILFQRHGLVVAGVERLPIHGGSLRAFVVPAATVSGRPEVEEMLLQEKDWGVSTPNFYRGFARKVELLKSSLLVILRKLKAEGKSIAAYGAAAKGTVLLNYCGIGPEILDFVADRSPHKQGRLMPGVRIPIAAPEKISAAMPDYLLLLAWNLAEEIMGQQGQYRQRAGKFIIPLPEPVIA